MRIITLEKLSEFLAKCKELFATKTEVDTALNEVYTNTNSLQNTLDKKLDFVIFDMANNQDITLDDIRTFLINEGLDITERNLVNIINTTRGEFFGIIRFDRAAGEQGVIYMSSFGANKNYTNWVTYANIKFVDIKWESPISDLENKKLYGIKIDADDNTTCERILNECKKDNNHVDEILAYVKYSNRDYYLLFQLYESSRGNVFDVCEMVTGRYYTTTGDYTDLANIKIRTIISSIQSTETYDTRINSAQSTGDEALLFADEARLTADSALLKADEALEAATGGAGGIAAVTKLDLTGEFTTSEIAFDGDGIYYTATYIMSSDTTDLSSGTQYQNLPIAEGSNIYFTQDQSVIKINAIGGGGSSGDDMPTLKFLGVTDIDNTFEYTYGNVFTFSFEIIGDFQEGDVIQLCHRSLYTYYKSETEPQRSKKYKLKPCYNEKLRFGSGSGNDNIYEINVNERDNATKKILLFKVPCYISPRVDQAMLRNQSSRKGNSNVYFRICRYADTGGNDRKFSNVVSISKYAYVPSEQGERNRIFFNY